MNPRAVHIHIERLVLQGYDHAAGFHLAATLERGLELLILERGLPALLEQPGHIPQLEGLASPAAPADPSTAGSSIAEAAYRSLGGTS